MPTAGTTHHIVLNDGSTSYGLMCCDGAGNVGFKGWRRTPMQRTSVKTSSGETKYSDLEPPYFTIAQDDWEGGRGQEYLEDKTRFYDSYRCWTVTKDQAILGPLKQAARGDYRTVSPNTPRSGETINGMLLGNTLLGAEASVIAQKVTIGSDDLTATGIRFLLGQIATSGYAWTDIPVYVYADDGGSPSLPTGSDLLNDANAVIAAADLTDEYKWHTAPVDYTFTASTSYWIALDCSFLLVGSYLSDMVAFAYGDEDDDMGMAKGSWSAYGSDGTAFYEIVGDEPHIIHKFQHYHGSLWAITKPTDGSAGRLLLNGDLGACDSNSGHLDRLIDNSKATTWSNDEFNGCVVRITGGPGDGEWRTITDTVTNGVNEAYLTVSPDWDTTHTTSSNYVILSSDKWTDVTPAAGNTIDAPCTDIIQAGAYLYIAQGKDQNILQYRQYNNSGTWATAAADVTDEKAELLAKHYTGSNNLIYKVVLDDTTGGRVVSHSKIKAAPTFDTDTAKTIWNRVNGMMVYNNILYVFSEDMVHAIQNNTLMKMDIDFASMKSEYNGVRPTQFNSFLFFPLVYGLERMSGTSIDDIGPNRDMGMPDGRQGHIVDMAATIGVLYAALDAEGDTSSILAYNNFGWHELVRASEADEEIKAVEYQVIPGGPNRLWFGEGGSIYFCELPSKTSNPWLDSAMSYAEIGHIITSWIDLGMQNVDKFWHELKINAEIPTNTGINAYYQTDTEGDGDSWHSIGSATSSGLTTLDMTSDDSLSGKRIRLKLELYTSDTSSTPRLLAWSMEAIARLQSKYSYAHFVKVTDNVRNIDGVNESTSAETILDQLDTWANDSTPLTLTIVDGHLTNNKVFVEPNDYVVQKWATDPQSDEQNVYIVQLRLLEA